MLFVVLFGIVITIIGLRLKQGVNFNNVYYEYRWNDFYNQEKSNSFLFVGSSHCYFSFIPTVFDTILNVNSFNLGSSNHSLLTSYYVLKEALRYSNGVDKVILEVFPASINLSDNFNNAIINFDNIKSYDVKIPLILTSDNYSDILEALIPAYRYNNYKTALIKEIPPRNIAVINRGLISTYFDKGYVKIVSNNDFVYKKKFKSQMIRDTVYSLRKLNSLLKISNMCKANNIDLIVITQPFNPLYFNDFNEYKYFHNTIDSIAQQNNFVYIDGNYVFNEIGLNEKDYYDEAHLLYSGAIKFSEWLANKVNSN